MWEDRNQSVKLFSCKHKFSPPNPHWIWQMWKHHLTFLVLGSGDSWIPGSHLIARVAYLVSSRSMRDLGSKIYVDSTWTNDTWGCSVIHTHVCVPLYTCTFLHSTYKKKHTQSIQMYRTLDGKPYGCLTSRELPVMWHSCVKQSVLQWNGFQVYGQDPCVSQSVEEKHMQINVSNKVLTFGNDLFLIKLM